MRTFQFGDSQSVLKTLEEIVELLAENNYAKAFDLFAEHKYFKYTPEELKDTIETYLEEKEPKNIVTSAFSATDLLPYKMQSLESEYDDFISVVHAQFPYCVAWNIEDDKYIGNYAHADLPINGKWSDLTLKFLFDEDDDKCWLVLEDVEVM